MMRGRLFFKSFTSDKSYIIELASGVRESSLDEVRNAFV